MRKLLAAEGLDPAARLELELVERNAALLVKHVDDLLDMSRIITGKLRVERAPLDPGAVVAAAAAALRPAAEEAGVSLTVDCDERLPRVMGDAERLRQVVSNLLHNAVKLTRPGGTARLDARQEGDEVVIAVRDDGIGLSQDALAQVFQRFWQVDAGATRKEGGLGLGLALVRHLVELHGGRVEAASPGLGCGATFTVIIPACRSEDARCGATREDVAAPLTGRTVLVVDEDDDMRTLLAIVLAEAGARTRTAAGAEDAARELAAGGFDAVVVEPAWRQTEGAALLARVRVPVIDASRSGGPRALVAAATRQLSPGKVVPATEPGLLL